MRIFNSSISKALKFPETVLPSGSIISFKALTLFMALEVLQPGYLYHIYNHAVGKDNLFLSEDNYRYFLKRYLHFIKPVADTYVYCLMPNHFHFLIEVKHDISVSKTNKYTIEQHVSKQFANLFSSYTQAFNKQQNRKGNLFISRFRREKVDSDEYVTRIIRYIHLNPVHHGFIKDFANWKYSSYHTLSSSNETFLVRDKVINWFGNLDEFKKAHIVFESPGPPRTFENDL